MNHPTGKLLGKSQQQKRWSNNSRAYTDEFGQ